MFSGFIDTLMYGFSSTGVTIYCYFDLKFNDNTCCEGDLMIMIQWQQINYLVCIIIFYLITVIFLIQNQYRSYLIKNCMHFFFFFVALQAEEKRGNQINILYEIKSKCINYNIRFLKLLLYDLKWISCTWRSQYWYTSIVHNTGIKICSSIVYQYCTSIVI